MVEHPVARHLNFIGKCLGSLSRRTHLSEYQLLILFIFPIIIVLGQLMSIFSPEETIHNYFTSRGNLVNTYFVKQGWLWTMLTYMNLVLNKLRRRALQRKTLLVSILRVSLITICWLLFTQWFFGPPLMDRIFVLTGGQCTNVKESSIPAALENLFHANSPASGGESFTSRSISSASCRRLKGLWEGGHDPSGHVFLLTLSCTVLIVESIELYTREDNLVQELMTKNLSWIQLILHPTMLTLVVVLTGLSMLLMTIVKYHSLYEQLGGFCAALVVIWMVNRIVKAFL